MTLPQINLDDRRFQELVNEARQRIAQSCPEWTEHNVSDPGITLIELFAWMTDMLLYRLNRIPDKLHIALLDLLGIRLHGPTAARTDLRFRLAAPPESRSRSRPGRPRSGRCARAAEESVVFQVAERRSRSSRCVPSAYVDQARRRGQADRVGDGAARPQGTDRLPFGRPPAPDDALLPRLRRRHRPTGHARRDRRLDGARRRRGPRGPAARLGGQPGRQPLGPGRRARRTAPAASTTAPGSIEVQCPLTLGHHLGGRTAAALAALPHHRPDPRRQDRRHLHQPARDLLDHGRPGRRAARRRALGARTRGGAGHQRRDAGPDLSPALRSRAPAAGRRDARGARPDQRAVGPWQAVESFAESTALDRHFHLDTNSGEIGFGPAVRQPRRRLDSIRRRAARRRGPAHDRLPTRRRAARQRRRPAR